jgi:hypothetical protein
MRSEILANTVLLMITSARSVNHDQSWSKYAIRNIKLLEVAFYLYISTSRWAL